jgi:FAD/FMN-containing dehydrogenase
MVLADVEAAAEAAGLRFPLSLGAKGSATVGGLVSTNAGGVQVLRHGTMRQLVLGVEAVLPDGTLLDQLGALAKDNSGYDIKQLLIGGEGTLGVVTAASLKLAPPLAAVAVGWAGVADPAAALALLGRMRHALGDRVESFELVGAAALDLVLRLLGRQPPLAGSHPFHLLFEVEADDAAVGAALAAALADGIVADATLAAGAAQAARLWQLREEIPEAERREGHSVKNDVAVPVGALPAFVAEALAMTERHFPGARPLVFGHVGDGNLHFNLRPPAGADPGWLGRHQDAARARLHDLVAAHGGSISAEHGIGTLKAAELRRLGDPGKLAAMRAVKRALDPAGIMNPGKLAV